MTNTTKKMTKREKFAILLNIEDVKNDPMLVEFIEHEVELLDRKNTSDKKPTTKQVENTVIKQKILAVLENDSDRLFTVTEILKELNDPTLGNQKVSALLRQMYDTTGENPTGEQFPVIRTEVKRKACFQFNPNFEG